MQVLQEFYVQATRSSRADALSHEIALELVSTFLRFAVLETTARMVLDSMRAQDRFGLSYWDTAVVEAARGAGL